MMIPVDVEDIVNGDTVTERLWLGPDTRVGLVGRHRDGATTFRQGTGLHIPLYAEIRPWWPKRPRFREPLWFEAVWQRDSFPKRVKRGCFLYIRSGNVWTGMGGIGPRWRKWRLSKREIQKLKLSKGLDTPGREVRMRFTLEKLYGLRYPKVVTFQIDGCWLQGTVGEYELWRDVARVKSNQRAKVQKRLRRYMRQPTWLERVLED
jgi:hypothetical protein